jgi:hypothetical protein
MPCCGGSAGALPVLGVPTGGFRPGVARGDAEESPRRDRKGPKERWARSRQPTSSIPLRGDQEFAALAQLGGGAGRCLGLARDGCRRTQRFVASCAHCLRASRRESHAVGCQRQRSRSARAASRSPDAYCRVLSSHLAAHGELFPASSHPNSRVVCVVGDRCIGGDNLRRATSLATRDVKCVARHAAARGATNHCYSKASDAACFFVPATMSPARCWRKHRRNLGKNRSCRTSQRFNALGNAVSCGQC